MSQGGVLARDRLAAAGLAAAYATLACCHVAGMAAPGRAVATVLLVAQELLLAALLVARRPSHTVSLRRSDRFMAAGALLVPP